MKRVKIGKSGRNGFRKSYKGVYYNDYRDKYLAYYCHRKSGPKPPTPLPKIKYLGRFYYAADAAKACDKYMTEIGDDIKLLQFTNNNEYLHALDEEKKMYHGADETFLRATQQTYNSYGIP